MDFFTLSDFLYFPNPFLILLGGLLEVSRHTVNLISLHVERNPSRNTYITKTELRFKLPFSYMNMKETTHDFLADDGRTYYMSE